MIADLRYALRILGKQPAFLLVAVLSLALGIAANVVMFSVVNAVLLRPLPVAAPTSLVRIGVATNGSGFFGLSHAEFTMLREGSDALDGAVAYRFNTVVLNALSGPREHAAEFVTSDYFAVLGVPPATGRGFLPHEAASGAAPVVVISDRLWQLEFGRDPDVVGRRVTLGGASATIVGVAPRGFTGTFPGVAPQVWIPLTHNDRLLPGRGRLDDPTERFLLVLGRLAVGRTLDDARTQLAALSPRVWPSGAAGRSLVPRPATGVIPPVAGVAGPFLTMLMGAVGLVLVIACANVAGLLTVRGEQRRRELAVRGALGASRRRLIGQLLVESMVLAVAGAATGILVSFAALTLVSRFEPTLGGVPVRFAPGIDGTVLAFTLAVTVGTGLLFGLMPAVRTTRVDLLTAVKEGGDGGGVRGSWVRGVLVVGQVALSMVLLLASGLLVRGLLAARNIDTGFDPAGIAVAEMSPHLVGYSEPEVRAYRKALEERLSGHPQLGGMAWGRFVPLGGGSDRLPTRLPGTAPDQTLPRFNYNVVDTRYFGLLAIPIVAGRNFDAGDRAGAPEVVVVNRTVADRMGGVAAALGQAMQLTDRTGDIRVVTIVGVVRDITYRRLSEGPTPFLYLPETQWYRAELQLHVRATATPLAAVVREAVRSVDVQVPVTARAMTDAMAFALLPTRIAGVILGISGILSLALAATGLYGVVSYAATSRVREIGIRLALGASPRSVGWLVLWGGIRLTIAGLIVGGATAVALVQLLRALLIGISPADPVTAAAAGLIMGSVSVAAAVMPARRASRRDLTAVLRTL